MARVVCRGMDAGWRSRSTQGWAKSELYLMDSKAGTPPTRITTGQGFFLCREIFRGKVYILTNEDAPSFRLFVTDAGNHDRENWKEIIPQTDAVLQGARSSAGRFLRNTSRTRLDS